MAGPTSIYRRVPRILRSNEGVQSISLLEVHSMADITFCTSSSGLTLYAVENHYYILNSTNLNQTEVGEIPSTHKDCPLALLVDQSNPQDPTFHIIIARPKFSDLSGYYYMEDFSSVTKEWTCHGHFSLSPIIPCTDVSTATRAYWLAKTSAMVEYDTTTNKSRIVLLPWQEQAAARQCRKDDLYRQLGKAGGNICFVLVTKAVGVEVFLKGPDEGTWTCYHKVAVEIRGAVASTSIYSGGHPIICRQMPLPLKFESCEKIEVLLWVDGQFVIMEDDRLGSPPDDRVPQRIRLVAFEGSEVVPDGVACH